MYKELLVANATLVNSTNAMGKAREIRVSLKIPKWNILSEIVMLILILLALVQTEKAVIFPSFPLMTTNDFNCVYLQSTVSSFHVCKV